MTVHCSKGLEFPVVFVAQMIEGQFPHAKCDDTVDEERRLAYVAFTRAQERLIITRSRTVMAMDRGERAPRAAAPSRFLFGIPLEVCAGELPTTAEAAPTAEATSIEEVRDRKRREFLSHLRRKTQPPPEGEYTLLDIEDPAQLKPGVKILHPLHGVGLIKARPQRARIQIAFGGRPAISLSLPGSNLKIVVE